MTDQIPKPMISIAGKTLIERLIHTIRNYGITKITVGVGWKKELLSSHLKSLEGNMNIDVIHAPDWENGPLQTLVTVLESIDGSHFLLCPADYVVIPENIQRIVQSHMNSEDQRLLTMGVDDSKETGTRVYMSDDRVVGVGRSQKESQRSLRSAMVVVANSIFSDYCKKALAAGASNVTDAINLAIDCGQEIHTTLLERESWLEIDNLPSVLRINEFILDSQLFSTEDSYSLYQGDLMETGSTIQFPTGHSIGSNVKMIGPVYLSNECDIGDNCEIGPYVSIDRGTTVTSGCKIKHAVIFEDSMIQNQNLDYAVVLNNMIFHLED